MPLRSTVSSAALRFQRCFHSSVIRRLDNTNHYDTLEVPQSASASDIKKCVRTVSATIALILNQKSGRSTAYQRPITRTTTQMTPKLLVGSSRSPRRTPFLATQKNGNDTTEMLWDSTMGARAAAVTLHQEAHMPPLGQQGDGPQVA
jgi:hypothetical protein